MLEENKFTISLVTQPPVALSPIRNGYLAIKNISKPSKNWEWLANREHVPGIFLFCDEPLVVDVCSPRKYKLQSLGKSSSLQQKPLPQGGTPVYVFFSCVSGKKVVLNVIFQFFFQNWITTANFSVCRIFLLSLMWKSSVTDKITLSKTSPSRVTGLWQW